jgi:hypothetical protein
MTRCLSLVAILAFLSGCTSFREVDELLSPQFYGYQAVPVVGTPIQPPTPANVGASDAIPNATLLPVPTSPAPIMATTATAIPMPAHRSPVYDRNSDPITTAGLNSLQGRVGLQDLPETADGRKILPRAPSIPIISIASIRTGMKEAAYAVPPDPTSQE